jgi:hypothetical protein
MKLSYVFWLGCVSLLVGTPTPAEQGPLKEMVCPHPRNWKPTSTELQRMLSEHDQWTGKEPFEMYDHPPKRTEGRANLCNADLRNAELNKANLAWAVLDGADLRGAKLNEATLFGSELKETNLAWVQLNEADFRMANLESANLFKAELTKAVFVRARLTKLGCYSPTWTKRFCRGPI